MKTDNPTETYQKLASEKEALQDAVDIDQLPPEQRAWLRATRTTDDTSEG